MCNACGFYCCASDEFEACGCDHCPNSKCWSDDPDEFDGDDDGFICEAVGRPLMRHLVDGHAVLLPADAKLCPRLTPDEAVPDEPLSGTY